MNTPEPQSFTTPATQPQQRPSCATASAGTLEQKSAVDEDPVPDPPSTMDKPAVPPREEEVGTKTADGPSQTSHGPGQARPCSTVVVNIDGPALALSDKNRGQALGGEAGSTAALGGALPPCVAKLAARVRECDAAIGNCETKATNADWHAAIMSAFRSSILISLSVNFDDPEAIQRFGAVYARLRRIPPVPLPSIDGRVSAVPQADVGKALEAAGSERFVAGTDETAGTRTKLANPGALQVPITAIGEWEPHLGQLRPIGKEASWDRAIMSAFRAAILRGLAVHEVELEAIEHLGKLYAELGQAQVPESDALENMSLKDHFRRIFGTIGRAA